MTEGDVEFTLALTTHERVTCESINGAHYTIGMFNWEGGDVMVHFLANVEPAPYGGGSGSRSPPPGQTTDR